MASSKQIARMVHRISHQQLRVSATIRRTRPEHLHPSNPNCLTL